MPNVQQTFTSSWTIIPSVERDFVAKFDTYKVVTGSNLDVSFDTYQTVQNTTVHLFNTYNYVYNIRFQTSWKIIPGVTNSLVIPFDLTNYVQNHINLLFEVEKGNYISSKLDVAFTEYNGISKSLTVPFGAYTRVTNNSLTEQFAIHSGVTNSLDIAYGMTPQRSDLGDDHVPMISTHRIYIV
jgi:hypothetical protein